MSKPVAVLVADAHIHPHQQFNTVDADGNSSRVMAGVAALNEALTFATDNQAHVFILGDLLHAKDAVPAQVIKPLVHLFEKHKKKGLTAHFLLGNHERPDRWSEHNTLAWLGVYGRIVTITEVFTWTPQIDVYLFPFHNQVPEQCERLRKLVSARSQERPEKIRILLGHGTVDGAMADTGVRLSNPELTPAALWLASFNLSFWGDIHKPQQIAPNAWYVGALMQNNWGERDNPPGFVVLNDDLTFAWMPVKSAPLFKLSDSAEKKIELDSGGAPVAYLRPNAETVAARAMEACGEVRLPILGDNLRDAVEAYMRVVPPPESITINDVVPLIERSLEEARRA